MEAHVVNQNQVVERADVCRQNLIPAAALALLHRLVEGREDEARPSDFTRVQVEVPGSSLESCVASVGVSPGSWDGLLLTTTSPGMLMVTRLPCCDHVPFAFNGVWLGAVAERFA
jgi:hypothetical protein